MSAVDMQVPVSILNDWLNVYVKDCFQLKSIYDHPENLYSYLQGVAHRGRIKKSLDFLLREGHLRRQLNGQIVPEVSLTVTDPGVSSQKIRQFHKAALKVAAGALELYTPEQRMANALLVPLTEKQYREFLKLLEEFSIKVQDFAQNIESATNLNAKESSSPRSECCGGVDRTEVDKNQQNLYQLIVNLCPVGGGHS